MLEVICQIEYVEMQGLSCINKLGEILKKTTHMKLKLLVIFILFFNLSFSQSNVDTTQQKSNSIQSQQDIFDLKIEIDRLKNANKSQTEKVTEVEKSFKADGINQKNDLIDRMNLYLIFVGLIITLIGGAINFFGKEAIKKRVEEIISDTIAQNAETKIVEILNSKITTELIEASIKAKGQEEIEKLIATIKNDGDEVIKKLEEKGAEAIKLMLAPPPKLEKSIQNNELSDSEITNQNDILRANEFFKIAYENTRDQRIKIELYKNVLEILPNNAEALNNIAVSHINLYEVNDAIVALNKAIEINPNYLLAYVNRAKAFNLQDKFEEALNDLESAYKINPKFEYLYSTKGNILTKQGKFDEAEIELNKSVELNPNSPEAYFNRGFFYEERGEYEKSKADYKLAEDLGVENKAALYNNIAVLYRRTKEFDKAIEYIEKAKANNPNFPNIDGTLALIYADKNDNENFYKYLQIALEKGCPAWNYLHDPGFNKYRDTPRLNQLIEAYKKKYFA